MVQPADKLILVVDDEPNVVTYLATLLHDNGYRIVSASDGKEGIDKVRSEKIDLVCLDISMPEHSGIRFYRDLRDDPKLSAIPVVMVTAVTGEAGDPEPFKRFISTRRQVPPPDAFFSKPIDKQEFVDTIAKLLS